jgi:ornithine cyclodeaminase/alanine dehydrogenase-like protein (mu-crystallin family)
MLVLSGKNVLELLSMENAIQIITSIMVKVSKGNCILPLRNAVDLGTSNKLGLMPGALSSGGTYGVKVLSLFPENPSKGLSSHLGLIILFDPLTGIPTAAINADAITAIRTAAATAAATNVLSRIDSTCLTLIGTGEQAVAHLKSISLVRNISKVEVAGRSFNKSKDFISKNQSEFPQIEFTGHNDIESAVKNSDIICTMTSSKNVVLRGKFIKKGTHVNAIGASLPIFQEIDSELVLKSKLFVDYIPSALAQAKEIIDGINSRSFTKKHIVGEIGQVFSGSIMGRTTPEEITLYRSLGVSAQDLTCAEFVLKKALELEIGIKSDIL